MTEKILLPCPFCGSESLKIEGKVKHTGYNWSGLPIRHLTVSVRCNKCKARGGAIGSKVIEYSRQAEERPLGLKTEFELREEAKDRWNQRAALQVEVKVVE